MNQEIRLLTHITLEVDANLSRAELIEKFNGCPVTLHLQGEYNNFENSILEIVDIEEEAELYNLE